jgi:hypothetical protein
MDAQTAINLAFALAGALASWVMTFIYGELRKMQREHHSLVEKLQAVELLVAGQYVKRDALERMESALFHKLDRIEAKLDLKMDKPGA